MNLKENERIDDLQYKGLKIIQNKTAFCFGIDSVLLSDFAKEIKNNSKVADLGTGNGIVGLLLCKKTKLNQIIGVEIQEEIADLAKRSVEYNALQKQITIYHNDLKDIYKLVGSSKFDVVTCNPPFFKYASSSNVNESVYQTIARHEVMANLDDIVKVSNILLKDKGTLAMVHRVDRMMEVIDTFKKYHFEIKRLRFVYPKKTSSEALSILIEAKKKGSSGGLKILKPLYVYDEENNNFINNELKKEKMQYINKIKTNFYTYYIDTLSDNIEDKDSETPTDYANSQSLKEQLYSSMKNLNEREQKVLRLRYGLDDNQPRTLEEVGRELGVTRERIRQIEAKAIRKLRNSTHAEHFNIY